MKKIKLIDNTLNPYDYLCHHIVPNNPIWYRDIEHPDVLVGIGNDGINQVLNDKRNIIKCAWVIEPTIINGEDYQLVVDNQDSLDYVFLHDVSFKNKINNFHFVPHGGTHLKNEDILIHAKNKLCSFIFSNKQWNSFHSFRHTIYKEMVNKVDCYGTGCNNYIENKSIALNDYCFSIAMENFNSLSLFTEKIIDCFLTGTIPIFYGCDNIGDFFNINGFYVFNTIEELNEIIKEISFGKYYEMLPYVQENFNKAMGYIFPEENISKIINNV